MAFSALLIVATCFWDVTTVEGSTWKSQDRSRLVNEELRLRHSSLSRLHTKEINTQPGFKSLKSAAINASNVQDRPIDFVYCWSGESQRQNASEGDIPSDEILGRGKSPTVSNVEGFHFDEMRLSLHTLQVNVPWFNKAYILVNGPSPKLPSWITDDPRIQMVDRCSLFPRKQDCPTKNSHACQSVVHRVPGLKEHFVYMEDDMFIVEPMKPSDLFAADGTPMMTAVVENMEVKGIYDTPVPESPAQKPGHVPPKHQPSRTHRWSHMPLPLTLEFAKALEDEYPDYFAFVRSHTVPFQCCDPSVNTYGLAEDFTRVWPAMMHLWNAGKAPGRNYEALCWCRQSVKDLLSCVRVRLNNAGLDDGLVSGPSKNCMVVQSCEKAEQWQAARGMIADYLKQYSQPHLDAGKPLVRLNMLNMLMRAHQGQDIPMAALYFIYAADCVLALAACWIIYSTYKSLGALPAGFLGLTTLPQFAILLGYMFFSVVHMFLQRRSGETGYSIIAATVLIYAGKTIVAFLMFLCRADAREGFAALWAPGCSRCGCLPAIILPMIPGGLLAGYDALSFLSLAGLDPATYQILVHMRIVLVCFLWQLMFSRRLSNTQWVAVLLFTAAGITKGFDGFQIAKVGFDRGLKVVIIQTLMSALANVSSEVLLKEMPMPADLVNTCMYFWGLLWLVLALLYQKGMGALYSELLAPEAWARLQGDSYMMGSILSLIALGIITAYLLKELSNIVKELSGGFVIVITCVVQMIATTMGILGCVMAVLGIGVYSTDPLKQPSQEQDKYTYMSPRGLPMRSPRISQGPGCAFQIVDETSEEDEYSSTRPPTSTHESARDLGP